MTTSMATPINNLPLKTQPSLEEQKDLQDPLVQDVLKEFEEELNASKKSQPPLQPPPSPFPPHYQQPPQPQYAYTPPLPPKPSSKFPTLEMDLIKKTAIVVILIALIFYPCLLPFIYSKFPEKTSLILNTYDIYIKLVLLFTVIYLLYFYKVL